MVADTIAAPIVVYRQDMNMRKWWRMSDGSGPVLLIISAAESDGIMQLQPWGKKISLYNQH
jgi:hypothetical protein